MTDGTVTRAYVVEIRIHLELDSSAMAGAVVGSDHRDVLLRTGTKAAPASDGKRCLGVPFEGLCPGDPPFGLARSCVSGRTGERRET